MFVDRISESKISTYEQCKLKYLYSYVKRYEENKKIPKHHLKFGSYIHKIFELGYEKTSEDELKLISKGIRNNFNFKQKIDEAKVDDCIKNFLKFNSGLAETVGVELEYIIEVKKGIKLNGIIDRIVKSPEGNYLIIDYKTSKRPLTKLGIYQNNQLKAYTYAVSKIFNVPVNKITASHFYPITGKFIHCTYTNAQINTFLQKRIDQVWEIRKKKAVDLVPSKNTFCDWCGYKDICSEFNDKYSIQAKLEERGKKAPRPKDPDALPPVEILLT
jgi:DNA helicase-2/ATP-dependent DNA helicase PcrA